MRIFKKILLGLLIFPFLLVSLSMIGRAPVSDEISWGVTFSEKYAGNLDLDWQEVYEALFDDLGVKKVRVPIYWDLLEKEKDVYDFEHIDWMLNEARERNVEVIPVIGMKVPRWPECHLPDWAEKLNKQEQQERILKLIEVIVKRYEDYENVVAWQVENEPFLKFGECPWSDKEFVYEEIALVKELDPETPVLVSESGELSTWFRAGKHADIVGTTLYRQNWWHRVGGGYYSYPITPVHYYRKSKLVEKLFEKKTVCVELQAEPWGPGPTFTISLEEQAKSMDILRFRENIEYAQNTGFSEFYLWGAEWWYWMKEKHGREEFWEEARELFD